MALPRSFVRVAIVVFFVCFNVGIDLMRQGDDAMRRLEVEEDCTAVLRSRIPAETDSSRNHLADSKPEATKADSDQVNKKFKEDIKEMIKQEVVTEMKNEIKESVMKEIKSELQGSIRTGLSGNVNVAPRRKWAYAFLIGGCNPENTNGYIGYVYNVAVAAHVLRTSGSKADVVLMIQLSYDFAGDRLPDDQEGLLRSVGVTIRYLPKPTMKENFYTVIMEKFRILDLIEYSRVLFLDSDVMPYGNLDFVFEIAEPEDGKSKIMENMVMGWNMEPSNAGFFLLKPEPTGFRQIQTMATERLKRDHAELPPPHFNETRGWGHVMEAPKDFARFYKGETVNHWGWHGGYADQGMLYYWTKYVKKSVTTVCRGFVENWTGATAEDVARNPDLKLGEVFVTKIDDPFENKTGISPSQNISFFRTYQPVVPHSEFHHFTGYNKPWENVPDHLIERPEDAKSPTEYWFHILRVLQKTLDDSILNKVDIAKMKTHDRIMDKFPKPEQVIAVVEDLNTKSEASR